MSLGMGQEGAVNIQPVNMEPARIETLAQLRELYKPPSERAQRKELTQLDVHCRRFIELSPFVVLATSSSSGSDATPRGGEPGFVHVEDESTLVLPDWPGNNRLDSLTNVLENPAVGLLFLIPGVGETLRVGGDAEIRTDSALLAHFRTANRLPLSVLVIHVEKAYLHCPKALLRSDLWQEEAKRERSVLPSLNAMLEDQLGKGRAASSESQDEMEARYRTQLY